MRALVQRVSSADVSVDGEVVGAIGTGLLALIGVTHSDTPRHARELARKVGGLRILDGERGVTDVPGAAVLAVSQFTLYGDVRKGRRPSWTAAAPGPVAAPLFDEFVVALRATGVPVHIGVFGARMRVRLTNEGPMTLLIDV